MGLGSCELAPWGFILNWGSVRPHDLLLRVPDDPLSSGFCQQPACLGSPQSCPRRSPVDCSSLAPHSLQDEAPFLNIPAHPLALLSFTSLPLPAKRRTDVSGVHSALPLFNSLFAQAVPSAWNAFPCCGPRANALLLFKPQFVSSTSSDRLPSVSDQAGPEPVSPLSQHPDV